MMSHVMLGSSDIERSKAFYDRLLGTLGIGPGVVDGHRAFWLNPSGGPTFAVSIPIDGNPPSFGNGSTFGFACASSEQVHAWYDAGIAAGGRSISAPYGPSFGKTGPLYLAYLRDPDGNKLCAMHRLPLDTAEVAAD